jgi:hypothetical protein
MGYACPVCDVPQRDAEHLANHLAFTALLRHGPHEEWLDEHLPEWGEAGPAELAERVVDHADAADYDEVFEDTVGAGADAFGHDGHDHGHGDVAGLDAGSPDLDAETRAVLDEARDLTREMLGDDGDDGDPDDETSDETSDDASV